MRTSLGKLFALALVLALGAGIVTAVPPPPPGGGPGRPGGPGGMRPDMGPPPLEELFPPEEVLQNQVALELTDGQLGSLKKLLIDTHGATIDSEFALQRAVENFHAALAAPRVDEAAALAAADKVMQLETATKKAHLTMLIRVKNLLTADQQKKLMAMRRPPRPRADD